MIKTKIFKEASRDCWGGNVNHKFLFDSVLTVHFSQVKIGICGTLPLQRSLPVSRLFGDPCSLFDNFIF